MQKNTILAYFIDLKTLDNSFIIDADYTVSFSSNTGIGTMLNQEISYNVGTSLNKNTFTKEGYNFIGWNTEADGTGASYIDEDNVTNIGDVTLYAQWEEKKYDITYFFGDERFVGTNYINTDIPLFNESNFNRDFEVSLSLNNFVYLSGQNQDRNVFICNQYERSSSISRFCVFI